MPQSHDNPYLNYPGSARSRSVHLSDGRCSSSSAETGVLMTITGHGPIAPVGGTHYHRQRANPNYYCSYQGSETPLTYPAASHPRTRGVPKWDMINIPAYVI
ncbi:hypothetical protein AVEN_40834-1 [Araneus ventricosus]|uniref:Uncharacterized protein n=1 Tax=Araneus ventricosus TaxID=182803 RepID=A0A4Y2CG37_ARAVE|nr:hypothetical protein AVEN_40834-1 [Araneus ventricosus]